MPRSSAYSALWMFFEMWSEMSLKKMLNRVGERQLPCGTPVLIVKVVEGVDFQVTWKVRFVKKSLTQFSRRGGRLAFWSLCMIP